VPPQETRPPPNLPHLKTYGLIGKSLAHSWSPAYFNGKFAREGLHDHSYRLFPLDAIEELPALIRVTPGLAGLNVTVPFKRSVMRWVQADAAAEAIGAVNTIRIRRSNGQPVLEGYNTDCDAFSDTYRSACAGHRQALVLGTGGAARAVRYALLRDGFENVDLVSRTPRAGESIGYEDLADGACMSSRTLIVNATPAGMYPATSSYPPLPYDQLGSGHLLIDLVYNPEETMFLRFGKRQGAAVINGLAMLHRQADLSWQLWDAS